MSLKYKQDRNVECGRPVDTCVSAVNAMSISSVTSGRQGCADCAYGQTTAPDHEEQKGGRDE